LLIFAPAADNGYHGHVGINLGDGTMVDAEKKVDVRPLNTAYWKSRYLGWMDPAPRWPGRASPAPPFVAPAPAPTPSPTPLATHVPRPQPLPTPDATRPTVPASIRVTGHTQSDIGLAWNASSDNVGVRGYSVYLNGTRVANVGTLSYNFGGLG